MAPKSAKKHHSAKNPHRNRQRTNANRGLMNARTDQNDTIKRVSHQEQLATFKNKTAPKTLFWIELASFQVEVFDGFLVDFLACR